MWVTFQQRTFSKPAMVSLHMTPQEAREFAEEIDDSFFSRGERQALWDAAAQAAGWDGRP